MASDIFAKYVLVTIARRSGPGNFPNSGHLSCGDMKWLAEYVGRDKRPRRLRSRLENFPFRRLMSRERDADSGFRISTYLHQIGERRRRRIGQ